MSKIIKLHHHCHLYSILGHSIIQKVFIVLSSLKYKDRFFFYGITGLFSAILQSSARSIALPIDQLKFSYQVLDNGEELEMLERSTVSFKDCLFSMICISDYSQHMILLMVLLLMESIWMVHNGIMNFIKLLIVLINDELIVYHLFCANLYRYSR